MNSEHYHDPTADMAIKLASVVHKAKQKVKAKNLKKLPFKRLKMVYVVSKLSGDIAKNMQMASSYCKLVHRHNMMPIASHIMYPSMGFDDNNPLERYMCRVYGLYLLAVCDEVHCFTVHGEISEGMKTELKLAKKLNIPIKYFRVEVKDANKYTGPRCIE